MAVQQAVKWRCTGYLGWALLMCASGLVLAEQPPDQWALCPDVLSGPPAPQNLQTTRIQGDGRIRIEADSASADAGGNYHFQGDVRLDSEGLALRAESVDYVRNQQQLSLQSDIQLEKDGFNAWGDAASFSLEQETGEISNSRFSLSERHVRGEADSIRFLGPRRYALKNASYTTCMSDNETWLLKAGHITLDYDNNTGTAKHVVLRFMDMPVFYFPWISFPVAGRKSGLLVPEFGTTSTLGNHWLQPLYWNIAPNQDATFSLHPTEKRGMHYLAEYRLLTSIGGGQINGEYLQRDKETDAERYYYGVQAGLRPARTLYASMNIQDVSDADYFSDFGDRSASALVSHVPRDFRLGWHPKRFRFNSRLLSYKTIDETIAPDARPYDLVPGMNFQLHPLGFAGMRYGMRADVTRFSSGVRVQGLRSYVYQSLQTSLAGNAWYLTPRVFHRYLDYQLDNTDPGHDGHSTLSVPGASLDTGLFLERAFTLDERNFIQTLEPRVFFLHVPYRDQNGMITDSGGVERVFDTALATMSWEGLFRENRYAGLDRVGDASQFTVSLASRVLDQESGRERLLAGIGQIHYLEDRRVTLPGEAVATTPRSDIFAVLRMKPKDWFRVNTGVQWSESLNDVTSSWFLLGYSPIRYNTANLGYRLDRDPISGDLLRLEQDLSFYWKVTRHFNLIGRRTRDVQGQTDREILFGFEYDDCCWAFRAVSRRYLPADILSADAKDSDYRNVVMLQLVLKGLTSVGSSVDSLLKDTQYGITGN